MMRNWIRNAGPLGLISLFAVLVIAGGAQAQPEFTELNGVWPFDVSADGAVVVGNDGAAYETFRWTAETGIVLLGMNTAGTGTGAGTPDVSADGNHVSATVLYPDSTMTGAAIWTKGIGWQYPYPPVPPEVDPSGNAYDSCWGLSADGSTLTGFHWGAGSDSVGSAQAMTWSQDDGLVSLPSPPGSAGACRGNDTSWDAMVVVGWSENDFGTWQPTVWDDGVVTQLTDRDMSAQAEGVSYDGNMLFGSAFDTLSGNVAAAVWHRTESGWQENILGTLPGTFPGYGYVRVADMNHDGTFAVGYNAFDWYSSAGFVWTLDEGMMSANDYVASRGVTLPETFVIAELTSCSDNGNVIVGSGFSGVTFPYIWTGFRITFDAVAEVPDVARRSGLTIEKNHPNPFNPSTTITLAIDKNQRVNLEIFDARGRMVRVLHEGPLTVGRHELRWDGRDAGGRQAASGMYFARARSESGALQSHRMMLVK